MQNDDQNASAFKDEWQFAFIVSKATERKIIQHQDFEAICSKFWCLVKCQEGANLSSKTIQQKQYTEFMKRVLKVLLPLYREVEVAKEIAQEWVLDSCGESEMSLLLFQKLLFKIAHSWATHVDTKEYVELLEKLFDRITVKRVTRGSTGKQEVFLPSFQVAISQPQYLEDGDWEEVPEEEEQDENMYDYDWQEDEHEIPKKMRRPKQDQKEKQDNAIISAREPLLFTERVNYYDDEDEAKALSLEDIEEDVFADMIDIYPLGYPTEQFLVKLRNDVHEAFEELKIQKKKALEAMKRQLLEGNATSMQMERQKDGGVEKDPGLIEERGIYFEPVFKMHDHVNGVRVKTKCHLRDAIYNQLRVIMRNENNLVIRPHFNSPTPATIAGKPTSKVISTTEHQTEINNVPGYNPVLERRIQMKMITSEHGTNSQKKQTKYINVNYMLCDPIYETAYRSDVRRVETSGNMSIKPLEGEFFKEEEFNPVTTSYREVMRIMLQQKFEGLYQEKIQHRDQAYDDRVDKIFNQEQMRKQNARFMEHLTAKGIDEVNHEIKTDDLRHRHGPFYQLVSKEGIYDDDFIYCGTMDLIEYANKEVIKILIIGKPRSGKSTLTRNLATSLDLVRISVDTWIDDFFFRIKDRIENPPDIEPQFETRVNEETGEEEQVELPPPEWRTPLEVSVQTTLENGKEIDQEDIEEMIKLQLHSNKAATKGFVLDLDFVSQKGNTWAERLTNKEILGDISFTHIVEIQLDDDEIGLRARNLRMNLETGKVYSKWERDELRKPKLVKLDENGDPIPDEEEEELDEDGNPKKKIPTESELVCRTCDEGPRILQEVEFYKSPEGERKECAVFFEEMFDSTFIKLDAAGLNPTELCDAVFFRLKPKTSEPLRPIPHVIEGAGSLKELLEDPGDEEATPPILPRKSQWSLWKNIDPVALLNGQVEEGSADFAVHFANNVFVFANEENMKAFIGNPRMYISKSPEMPPDFRVLMLGPKGVGKLTQAQKLEHFYGWRVVNFLDVVQSKLARILQQKIKPPNNVVENSEINMSQEELDKLKEGAPIPSWKFLPWVLEYLNIPLKRKPVVPKAPEPEPNIEEMDEAEKKVFLATQKKKAAEEAKKAKEAAEAEAAKKERDRKREELRTQGLEPAENGMPDSDIEIIIDDLPLDQLTIDTDPQEDGTVAKVDRVILLGFPQTEVHVEKMKELGFGFDRIIYLTCKNEEEPGKEVTKRNTNSDGISYSFETEEETSRKVLAISQGIMTSEEQPDFDAEKILKEVDCNGTTEEVFIKIRTALDPFFLQPDNPENCIMSAELEEDDDGNKKRLPKSDFGDYCPVTFVDEGYMVKGDPEQESLVYGKTYLFSSEREKAIFDKDPVKYMVAFTGKQTLPLQPPAPKIMLIGNKGAGVTTQIRMLCDKFKLDEFELQKKFLAKLKSEQEKRQRQRLLERGYKAMPVDEETGEMERDPEIMDDAEDFDPAEAEKKFMAEIFDANKGLVIDGHWTTLPDEAVNTELAELLTSAKRMPEIVIVLKCKEASTFDRTISKDKIKEEFDKIMKEREIEIEKKRAEARKAEIDTKFEELKAGADEETTEQQIQAKLNEEMKDWDETEKEKDPNEYLEEEPPVLEEMIQKIQEETQAQIEKDNGFIDDLIEKLKEKQVEVVENINTDISAEYVHIKIVDKLKGHLKYRCDLIEREQAKILPKAEVQKLEQSYTYKHSKFGLNSPISPFFPTKTKDHAVLYRERIYFLSNKEEQQQFLLQPSKYVKGVESVPSDILVKPKIFVLGLPKSGKSDLCKTLCDKVGVVHLQVEQIIEDFMSRDSSFANRLIDTMKLKGREIDDLNLIQLICKRIERRDCRENGWVLEDFPKTRAQAKMMSQRGITPTNVFNMDIPCCEVFSRTAAGQDSDFDCNRQVLKMRLQYGNHHKPQVLYYYQKFYNSVTFINGMKSRWFIQDLALEAIENNLKARLSFARDFFFRKSEERPCLMEHMNVDRIIMKQSLSQFGYFCPVSYKNKAFRHASHLPELTVLYNHLFYYFASVKERDTFVKNPELFTQKIMFASEKRKPILLTSWKAGEMAATEKELQNFCPVSLKNEEKIEVGSHLLCVKFDNKNFVFGNAEKAKAFFTMPHLYFKTQLPVKLPPKKDPVGLYALSKKEESITFLEQALGNVVTLGLREVGESRLKYPTMSIKETSLKLFALFIKAENPANTAYMKEKYEQKCKDFLEVCTIMEELHELAEEKEKKQAKGRWPQFKEDYYNELGRKYDAIMLKTEKDRAAGFWDYMK